MATGKSKATDVDSAPSSPQTTPDRIAHGQPGHDFTLQAVMELQKSVGELVARVDALRSSVDGVRSKVDDLVGWKHRIVGGAVVFGVVATVLGFVIGKASDYVTLTPKQAAPPAQQAPTK